KFAFARLTRAASRRARNSARASACEKVSVLSAHVGVVAISSAQSAILNALFIGPSLWVHSNYLLVGHGAATIRRHSNRGLMIASVGATSVGTNARNWHSRRSLGRDLNGTRAKVDCGLNSRLHIVEAILQQFAEVGLLQTANGKRR